MARHLLALLAKPKDGNCNACHNIALVKLEIGDDQMCAVVRLCLECLRILKGAIGRVD